MVTRCRHILLTWLLVLVVFAVWSAPVASQSYNPFNERDDQYRLLGLKRAREAFTVAKAEYERQKELFDKHLITELELERAQNVFTDAEVNYQQSLLAVMFEEQFVSVSSAVKYQAADGSKHVRLTIQNTSHGSAEFVKLADVDSDLFSALKPDIVNNVYVSLLNDDDAIVSQPYEAKIEQVRYGHPVELDFALLQDLDAVTVFIIYANGAQRTMKIFLQKDSSVDRVLVQSEQFSQEVDLGAGASYDLTLELFSGTNNTFSLEVVNLPAQIGRYFEDRSSGARLSQVKFAESTLAKQAALRIALPDRPTDSVAMDTPITFFVLVLPRTVAKGIPDLHTRTWTESEIATLDVGYVRLELVPRGMGELLVRLPQLYHTIESDGTAEMFLELVNEGSSSLNNIEIKADLPLNWTKQIEPGLIPALGISADERVRLAFSPPADVAPGKYNIRVRTSAMSNNRPVSTEDKTITVEIEGETSVVATASIVFVLIGLVGGIVLYGIKLSRR